MISILINSGIIKRTTTAGKESTGNVTFMGGSCYIPNLDSKYKDGEYSEIRLEAEYRGERFGWATPSVIDAKPISK